MASTQQTPPTLRLDPTTKSPTSVLLPLAISLHLASSLPQPIPVEWQEKLPQSVALVTHEGQEIQGVEAVSKWLVNSYAHLGIGGKDNSNSQQVRRVTTGDPRISIPRSSVLFLLQSDLAADGQSIRPTQTPLHSDPDRGRLLR